MNLQTVNFITDLGKLALIMVVICFPFIIGAMYFGFRNFTKEMIDYAKDKHLRDDNEEDKKW